MAIYDNQPQNRNYLSPLNFQFSIKKAPAVNFFIQQVNLPELNLPVAEQNNPFVVSPIPGDHLSFSPLSITFTVDEDIKNYLEIHNWMKMLGKPEDFHQFKEIEQQQSYTGGGVLSDITLFILGSTKRPNYTVVFTDAFPVSLSGLTFDSTKSDVAYLTATAKFKYTYYDINQIT